MQLSDIKHDILHSTSLKKLEIISKPRFKFLSRCKFKPKFIENSYIEYKEKILKIKKLALSFISIFATLHELCLL